MTSKDFMEEKEVFELLGKKKQLCGVYVKSMVFLNLFSPIQHAIAGKQFQNGWREVELIATDKLTKSKTQWL
jgi:hypothetical protein